MRGVGGSAARAAVLCSLLLVLGYASTLYWMGDRWLAPRSVYSHGPLVTLAAGFFFFRDRKRRASLEGLARLALPLLAAGLALRVLGALASIDSVSGLSLLPTLAGLAGALGGPRALRAALPALGLFALGLPVPLKVVSDLSFHLKEASATASVAIANAFGADLRRFGSAVHLPGKAGTLEIGDACSGLASLLALASLAYAYGFFFVERRLRSRLLLLLLSVPAALAGNAVRLALVYAAAMRVGVAAASGWIHEALAVPLYLGVFAGLVVLDRFLHRGTATAAPAPRVVGGFRPASGRALALCAAGAAIALGIEAARSGPASNGPFVLPSQIGEWGGTDLPVTERMFALLETRDVLFRRYDREGEDPVTVALVRGAGRRRAAHPPDLCYIGSGFEVTARDGEALVLEGKRFPLARLEVRNREGSLLCLYAFLSGGRVTASYFRHQWDFFRDALSGKGGRSLLLRLDTALRPGGEEEARRRLLEFASLVVPLLREAS